MLPDHPYENMYIYVDEVHKYSEQLNAANNSNTAAS